MLTQLQKKLSKFQGKKILVLGIGNLGGGSGVAQFFAELNAKVTATDLKPAGQLDRKQLKALHERKIKLVLGKHRESDILKADLVIRNPSVPLNSTYLQLAFKNKTPVVMETALFAKLCPLPIIGITGTRGKTTTTYMLASILRAAGLHTLVGGNVKGNATLPLLRKLKQDTKVVLELSSWALQGFGWERISPDIGLITNIYPDHLNRYASMKEYIQDKEIIFRYQQAEDLLVLNRDNRYAKQFTQKALARVKYFSASKLASDIQLKVPGRHNRANAAAARSIAKLLDIADGIIKKALQDFKGMPYRLQMVRKINGVSFINDTTSTTPIATITALRAFHNKPIVLIIGGAAKNLPLEELIEELKKSSVKEYIFLAGDGTDSLLKLLKKHKLLKTKPNIFNNLEEAVRNAYNSTTTGDIVLFSPAFTSFAMFKNEFDRGDQFNKIVEEL